MPLVLLCSACAPRCAAAPGARLLAALPPSSSLSSTARPPPCATMPPAAATARSSAPWTRSPSSPEQDRRRPELLPEEGTEEGTAVRFELSSRRVGNLIPVVGSVTSSGKIVLGTPTRAQLGRLSSKYSDLCTIFSQTN